MVYHGFQILSGPRMIRSKKSIGFPTAPSKVYGTYIYVMGNKLLCASGYVWALGIAFKAMYKYSYLSGWGRSKTPIQIQKVSIFQF